MTEETTKPAFADLDANCKELQESAKKWPANRARFRQSVTQLVDKAIKVATSLPPSFLRDYRGQLQTGRQDWLRANTPSAAAAAANDACALVDDLKLVVERRAEARLHAEVEHDVVSTCLSGPLNRLQGRAFSAAKKVTRSIRRVATAVESLPGSGGKPLVVRLSKEGPELTRAKDEARLMRDRLKLPPDAKEQSAPPFSNGTDPTCRPVRPDAISDQLKVQLGPVGASGKKACQFKGPYATAANGDPEKTPGTFTWHSEGRFQGSDGRDYRWDLDRQRFVPLDPSPKATV